MQVLGDLPHPGRTVITVELADWDLGPAQVLDCLETMAPGNQYWLSLGMSDRDRGL